jgi:hypothetical protein
MHLSRILVWVALFCPPLLCQTASLRGQVTDESGAIVPGAKVAVTGPASKIATSGNDGAYSIAGLPPGNYTVQATAPQLALPQTVKVTLTTTAQTLNLSLAIAAERQQVTVEDTGGPTVSTDAANNASAMVLRGADLDALPDDPDDLAEALQALAGPSAGPNGGSIFIDGFSGGQLPPKDSIREIRINQNPFSPEYDKLGLGRIEIFTKPGTDKFHGMVRYNFADDFWNSRNAYAAQKAPFHINELQSDLNGPLNKHASYTLALQREEVNNGSVVNAVTLDSFPGRFTDTPIAQQRRSVISPRVDYQLGASNTLMVRYSFNREEIHNAGIGGLNLAERGYHEDHRSNTLQLIETAVLSTTVINETRFQYFRPVSELTANTPGAAIQVLGSFNAGGAQVGHTTDTQNTYELQNYTSMVRGTHSWRWGVRLRGVTDTNVSPQNFGGTFTFGSGDNYDSLERYRRTVVYQQQGLTPAQIRALGGGATQFTINTGNPLIDAGQFDLGAFVGDDWKARPNLTVSMGLRYETQTNIHDHADFAPRIGAAWAPGAKSARSRPKSVIRAGFGMFYDRFALSNTIAAMRYNGVIQQQYVINNPDFFPGGTQLTVFGPGGLSGAAQALPSNIQAISSTLRTPYIMQSAIGFERQLPFNTTAAITFASSHGLHLLRSEDLPSGAARLFLTESSGLYNQNQIIFNVNSRVSKDVSLTGSYVYNRAHSNTDGAGTFPANPATMEGEYGPAATDIHHRVSLNGTIVTKWGIRWNPLLTANTGPPFDITVGHDLYGDTLFNGRPGIVTSLGKPGVIATPYGLLDPNPTPGEPLVPRNFGRGPGQVMLNLRIGRTFSFGRARESAIQQQQPGQGGPNRGGPSGPFAVGGSGSAGVMGPVSRRFGLTVSMYIRNITNHNNPGPIIGNLASPLFGQANQPAGAGAGVFSEAANNRRFELQTRLTF